MPLRPPPPNPTTLNKCMHLPQHPQTPPGVLDFDQTRAGSPVRARHRICFHSALVSRYSSVEMRCSHAEKRERERDMRKRSVTVVTGILECQEGYPDGELGNPAEDGEEAGLKRKAVSQGETEGEVDGEEDEEAPHSCAGCRQVFESLNDLNEHKINQCQLTVSSELKRS
ncbi:hypothetical protein JZ751_015548 [Albula glossodonta]|uniref:Uncharacterized protein n=1 Tax=Albula glossodonta TaxID=121402 RepID=A0A8T2MVP7_9TELE|nr:hypothetical protein JZ751_015548 [Albula glossodonta]